MLNFMGINYAAVAAATGAAYLLGVLWYSPVLFGPARTTVTGFFLTFSIGLSLAFAQQMTGLTTWSNGAFLAFLLATGFILPHAIHERLLDGGSWKTLAVHQGYRLLSLLAMGAILGAWR